MEHHSRLAGLDISSYRHVKQVVLLLTTLLIASSVGFVWHALAQSNEGPWTQPVNISDSGAASQPIIAVAPDGTLHALWWDAIEGEKYARGAGITQTVWSKPATVPAILGGRLTSTNAQTGKTTVSLAAAREVRILSDARNNVYAFWLDADNQLLGAHALGGEWSGGEVLADSALNMGIVADVKGILHLAYLRTLNTPGNPSGIYYRTATRGTDWSVPVLVFPSLYFRSAKSEQAHNISVAGDGQGNVIIVWDDLEQGQNFYSQSANGGRTWSQPQLVAGSKTGSATRAYVTATPKGDFFFLWQDTSTGGCGVSQRRSTDGGQTWSTSERVLSGLNRCLDSWSFDFGDGGTLWLIGATAVDRTTPTSGSTILAVWDGRAWSQPVDVNANYRDMTTGKSGGLGCLSVGLAGQTAGVIGCGPDGNVWAAHNAVELNRLIPAVKSAWSVPEPLLDQAGPLNVSDVPALTADSQGNLYAAWSMSSDPDGPGTLLYSAVWNSNRWSRAVPAIRPKTGKAEQPSLAADSQGRLHLVWSGGNSGDILYSWKYARDAASTLGWSEPLELSAQTSTSSWPSILADPRGDVLHVIYAVPYNEKRGIYYVRSNDGGTTWLTPTVIFDAAAAGWDSVNKPRLALDVGTGVLHAVWLRANLPGGVNPQAVAYSHSTDDGKTWSAPIDIAEGNVDWPQVAIFSAGRVLLIWNQAQSSIGGSPLFEAWSEFSTTGGEQWTEAARVRGFGELGGPVGLTADHAGGLSLVGVSQDTSGESILVYSHWDGQTWSAQETFGLGHNAAPGDAASVALMPEAGRLNVAMREWVTAPDGTSYFDARATGREVTIVPATERVPTLTPLPTPRPTVTAIPYPTATARPKLPQGEATQSTGTNPLQGQSPLVMAGVMAAVIVGGVMLGRVIWTMRH
jgi:hypothetical protein